MAAATAASSSWAKSCCSQVSNVHRLYPLRGPLGGVSAAALPVVKKGFSELHGWPKDAAPDGETTHLGGFIRGGSGCKEVIHTYREEAVLRQLGLKPQALLSSLRLSCS